MARLDGKVAIITGGSGGIGKAAGRLFVEAGAKVLLVDLAEEPLKQAVQDIGGDAVSYALADVTDPEQSQAYVRTAVERYDGVDILLANAGIEGVVQAITDYPIDMFDKVMAVNVRGVWLGLKYVMPEMEKRITSKHAVVGLMRTAALEGAKKGIRVNTVNPGPIETRMMRSLEEGFSPDAPAQAKEGFATMLPLHRYGEPQEVSQLVLFLASDDSSYCTGGVYMVDGGMSA